jgi:hypothetical protein
MGCLCTILNCLGEGGLVADSPVVLELATSRCETLKQSLSDGKGPEDVNASSFSLKSSLYRNHGPFLKKNTLFGQKLDYFEKGGLF